VHSARKLAETEQRTEKQREERTDHRLRGERKKHQWIFARAELGRAPLAVAFFLAYLRRVGLFLSVAYVAQRHRVRARHFARQALRELEADVRVRDLRRRETGNRRL
jgi:hypothetical protein